MRSQLGAVTLGAVVALAAILAVLWLSAPAPTAGSRTDALAAELRCPDCQGLSVADSQTPAAREIRSQIGSLVAAGATDDEVRGHFVDRYGEWILLAPRAPWPWLVPLAAVVAAIVALVIWLRGRAPTDPDAGPVPSDDARRRIREEVEALDA